jgi:hypothetical protein
MKTSYTLEDIEAALQPLHQLEATLEAELRDLESRRRTPYDFNHPADVRQSLRQLREGAALAVEGVETRVFEVLNTPEMRRFHLAAPGIAPLLRLRDRLIAQEQAEKEQADKAQRMGKYRYIGPPWKHAITSEPLKPGDVVALSELYAEQYPHRFEPVGD